MKWQNQMYEKLEALPPLRKVIEETELNAKKSLGQNFLLDLNLTRKIARQAGKLEGYDVLEIGPGPGGLTRGLLLEGARHVIVVERDERVRPILEEINTASSGRLTPIFGDALDVDYTPHITQPLKIVANLPYNVGTELLVRWLTPQVWPPQWVSLTLMFQKEVAHRIVAQPNSKAYGRLAVLSQWRSDAKIMMDLPPQAFTPAPKVSSSVVHLTALPKPRYEANQRILERVVALAFNQRRKMLRASLKSLAPNITDILKISEIDETMRAENVSIEAFCRLAREFENAKSQG